MQYNYKNIKTYLVNFKYVFCLSIDKIAIYDIIKPAKDGVMKLFDNLRRKSKDTSLKVATSEATSIKPQKQIASKNVDSPLQQLLNSSIPKEFIVEASYIVEQGGHIAYICRDYFWCDVPRKSIKYREGLKVTKVSGDNIGEKYSIKYDTNGSVIDVNGQSWLCPDMEPFIPHGGKTIGDLNAYANAENAKRKTAYERALKSKQELQAVQNALSK